MLIFAALFLVMGVIVLKARPRAIRPDSTALYRLDNRVVAVVLFIIGGSLLLLSYSEIREFLR